MLRRTYSQPLWNDGKMFHLCEKLNSSPPGPGSPLRRFLGWIRGVTGREVVVGIIVSYFYHFLTTFIQVEQKVVLPEGPRLGGLAQRFRGGSEANPIYFRFSIPSARRQCLNDQHNEKYKRYVHFTKLASGGTLK